MAQPENYKFSYSSTDTYRTCANQFHKVHWLKIFSDGDPHPQAVRGDIMHTEFENCVNQDTDYSDPQYQWVLDEFRAKTGLKIAEQKLAINADWEPTPYDLGKDPEGKIIPNPDAWYRGKVDFTVINGTHADVDDAKTGKRKFKMPASYETWLLERHETGMKTAPEMQANARQGCEYALLIFLHFPEIQTIRFRFVWTDCEDTREDVFNYDRQRDYDDLIRTILATPRDILESDSTDTWDTNPSGLCANNCCVVSCEFHGMPYWKIKKRLKGQK